MKQAPQVCCSKHDHILEIKPGRLKSKKLFGRDRLVRTRVLGIMRALGQEFNIVAVQMPNLVQKPNDEEALTRSVGLS